MGLLPSLSESFTHLLISSAVLLLAVYQITWAYAKLRDVPGPIAAKFTNLWRLLVVWSRDSHDTYLCLHKQHGDVVRTGPNVVSICKPDMVQQIYGVQKGYVKSDFYAVWQTIVSGKRTPSLVFTTDEALHAKMKRPIAQSFSLSTLVEFEPLIDSTTAVFLTRLDKLYASTGKVCDLGQWLQWYAFDVIGELTFSRRLGFMERAEDVEGIIASVSANFDRCSVLGQMPWLDLWTYKNPVYLMLFAKPVSSPIVGFGQRRLQERLNGGDKQSQAVIDVPDPALRAKVLHGTIPTKPDFLSRFLTLHKDQPDIVTDRQMLAYLFANINAGSDTIGSTLRAIFYYLLKSPRSLAELVEELDDAQAAGNLTAPIPTWPECQSLHYLNAVIKEALRLNPALALPMERVVPGPGLHVGEHFLPAGTVVGINPWVLHRDQRIFGKDAEDWRPRRWLDADVEKVRYMEQHILAFGAGKRTCLGRNVAMLELGKLVPALLLRYEMMLVKPEEEWRVINSWVVRQEGVEVSIRRSTSALRSSSRSKRPTTNLSNLRLAPLSTKFAEPPVQDSTAVKSPYEADSSAAFARHHSSYLQGRSAPSTPGILSRTSSRRQFTGGLSRRGSLYEDDTPVQYAALSRDGRDKVRVEVGSGQIPKAKSDEALLAAERLSSGQTRQKRQKQVGSKTGANTPRAKSKVGLDEDWLSRTRASTNALVQEAKGQSWLASRESSTSLAHLDSDDDDEGYEEMAALSASQARFQILADAASPASTRIRSPAWGSRYGSRTGSRMTSRRGTTLEPDFVDEDVEDDEGDVGRLTGNASFGLGGIVDRLMGFNLFGVEEDAEATDEEEREDETEEQRRQRLEDEKRRRREQSKSVVVPAPESGEDGVNEGWRDAAWLFSVATKTLFT
ncbi:putative Cytochrome-P450 family protein [Teratosphaeria destructans]|uniref:Cytochrome-P450 family protein n=1 Tax=Teratosphaeria destructans TaxID=418781 RepID=A0A9W7VXL4_9PEZI|nr:putative Cytochrome-P450 family protein [Teratosphaeria destructans]